MNHDENYNRNTFPLQATSQEIFLIEAYDELLQAQNIFKNYKDFKKVQRKELADKKKARIAAKREGIKLSEVEIIPAAKKVKTEEDQNSKITDSVASSNTEALKQLIKSGGFSLSNNKRKPLKKGAKRIQHDVMFGPSSSSSKISPEIGHKHLSRLDSTTSTGLLETPKDITPENSEKTYSDTPNNRIKVYLGPNYQESDVRNIFGSYGEIKKVICLSSIKGPHKDKKAVNLNTKPECSEVCIIHYSNINSAINAKNELHQTLHREFVAKISVTFIKKEKNKNNDENGKKIRKNSGNRNGFVPNKRYPMANVARPGFERRRELEDHDPEAHGRKMVSYDEDDLFD